MSRRAFPLRQGDCSDAGKRARQITDPRDHGGESGDGGQGVGEAHVETVASEDRTEDKHRMSCKCARGEPAGNRVGVRRRRTNARRKALPFERCRRQVGGRNQQVE